MNWQREFAELCAKYSIEPLINGETNEILLVCPKIPDSSIQSKFKGCFPEGANYRFQEGPRMSTTEGLRVTLTKAGATSASLEITDHTLVVSVSSMSPLLTEEDSELWPVVRSLLQNDPFVEGWKITVNDKVMSVYDRKIADMVAKQVRPDRQVGFTNDDILNLKIALESTQDVNDFINSL